MSKAGWGACQQWNDERISALEQALKVAVSALERYEHYVCAHTVLTPESAKFQREFGIGKIAVEALAEIRRMGGE